MSNSDQAVRVFEGPAAEVLFLKTLLDAAGIDSTVTGFHGSFGPPEYLTVQQRDEAAARAVIADFERHGQRGRAGWPR